MTALTHEYFERLAGKIITSFKTNVVLGRIFPPLLTMFSLGEKKEGGGGVGEEQEMTSLTNCKMLLFLIRRNLKTLNTP